MAYRFAAGTTDRVDAGTGVTHATSYSLAVRFKVNGTLGNLLQFRRGSDGHCNAYLTTYLGQIYAGHTHAGAGEGPAAWTHGFATGSTHVLVYTYNNTAGGGGALYADTDVTAKVTSSNTGAAHIPDQETDQHFYIGSDGGTGSANADIYEIAWYPGVVLTGAQAVALGAGGQMALDFPEPTDYWFGTQNALDMFGGQDGTVTGATLQDAVGTPWFPRASTPAGVTYYVKTGGNDSANGLSDATAWATIGKINTRVLNPGDIVQFRGGNTFAGSLTPIFSDATGNPDTPIIFRSYGTGKATIAPAADDTGVDIDPAPSGIELRNLIVQSSQNLATTTTYALGIHVENTGATSPTSHLYIDGCEVYGFSHSGIGIYGQQANASASFDDVRITNCISNGNLNGGITTLDKYNWANSLTAGGITNAYIADCVANDNLGTGSGHALPNLQGNGFGPSSWTGGTIERCTASGNGVAASGVGGGASGIVLYLTTGTTVQYCEASESGGLTVDGAGIDADINCTGCILQYNYTHDNRAEGFFVYSNGGAANVVRYNISENDGKLAPEANYSAIRIYSGVADVYGNTVYASAGAGAPIAVSVEGTAIARVFNNVLLTSGSGGKVLMVGDAATATINGNAYWQTSDTTTFRATWGATTYTSLAAFRTGTSQETGTGYDVDPLLVDPGTAGTIGAPMTVGALRAGLAMYRPQSGSWVAGAGLDLDPYGISAPGTEDFFGVTLPTSGLTTLGASLAAATFSDSDLLLLLAPPAEARA